MLGAATANPYHGALSLRFEAENLLASSSRTSLIFLAVLFAAALLWVAARVVGDPPPPPPNDRFHGNLGADPSANDPVDFNEDIRPILATNCLVCHGFDSSTREADLRLDIRQGALAARDASGSAAVAPGDANASLLLKKVSAVDPDDRMPPDGRPALSAHEIELFRRWINQGAHYDTHWSFKPIVDHEPPATVNDEWARDDIDRFILSRLESKSLQPADRADKATLIRRAYFDLIGLPPTPQQVDRFIANDDANVFAQTIDELLASPHFGERWGRHWLDLMRYAETHGHEFDYPIKYAWQYRDYVIRALNEDVPYDDLIREHIAGDLVSSPRLHPTEQYNESLIATGWWWLSQGTHAPVDVRADEAERVDNQIDVLSKTFLGLTVACARCHDHKFDPITQRDYYALYGFVQSSRRQEAFLDPNGTIAAVLEELIPVRHETAAALRRELANATVDRLDEHVAAALEVMHGERLPGDGEVEPPYVVFDDFEAGDYARWTIEGGAFGPAPYTQDTLGKHQGDVAAHGTSFVNSHNTRSGETVREADEHVGAMTSEPFTIEHRFVHFLIGGGAHKDRTCINLIGEDDAVLRTAVGRNSNRMRRHHWDVADLVGQVARFQIVDNEKGGWGNIGIDHIVFADSDRLYAPNTRPLDVVAAQYQLPRSDLLRWINALHSDPQMFNENTEDDDAHDDVLIHSFDHDTFEQWFASGQAFDAPPSRSGDLIAGAQQLATPGAAHSGLTATKLQGALRSPTFELTHPYIHYRVKGTGGRIRLIIDGYFLDEYNPLLFDGVTFNVNTRNADDGPQWRTHVQPVLDKYIGHRAYIEILDEGDGWLAVDEIRLSGRSSVDSGGVLTNGTAAPAGIEHAASRLSARITAAIESVVEQRADAGQTQLVNWVMTHDLIEFDAIGQLSLLYQECERLNGKIPAPLRALAITDGSPEDEYVFIRGSHAHLGERVPRRFIERLAEPQQSPITVGSGRLQLAERILSDSNPLPARVIVNRTWQHLFGAPLAPTPDDFGGLGQSPTHAQLLDYLAHWFRTDGQWSIKRLIRRLMLTQSYQMSSDARDGLAEEAGPTNMLYHRMNLKRLEGEVIRDAILAISGRLDPQMYGPPIPIHLTAFMQGRGRPGKSGPLDGDGRRSIYISVRRNFLSPMMLAFDTPVPHSTVGRRNASNVPAQALILMNDPLVAQQARLWATALLDTPGLTDEQRIEQMYLTAFSRPPSGEETRFALEYLHQAGNGADPTDGDAQTDIDRWSDLCHVLFTVKEFVFLR